MSYKKSSVAKDSAVTILTSGCHFDGKLYCRGASRIGGKIEGQIISEGLLIIEEEAVITASIKADEAVIQGTVKGKLEATGRTELSKTSKFEGDISTPILVVTEGAKFNGRSFMIMKQNPTTKNKPKIFDEDIPKIKTTDPKKPTNNPPEIAVG